MKEILNMIRMSKNTPPMIDPLINLIKYNIITPFGDQIFLGIAPDLPSLHDHTKSFFKQLRAIKGVLQTPATPIAQQEYMEKFNRIREATSLRPSYNMPDMVKTEALDP